MEEANDKYYIDKYKDSVFLYFSGQLRLLGKRTFKFSEIKENFKTLTDLNLKSVLQSLVDEKKLQLGEGRAIIYTFLGSSEPVVPLVTSSVEASHLHKELVKVCPRPILTEVVGKKRPLDSVAAVTKLTAKDVENVASGSNCTTDVKVPNDQIVQKYSLTAYECSTILPILSQALAVSEGVLPVEDFKVMLSSRSTLDVNTQFGSILRFFEDQNKIMVSEGNIYEI